MLGRFQHKLGGLLVTAVAIGSLAACGHSSSSDVPLVKRHAASGGAAHAAPDGPTDLVAAVSAGGTDDGPVGLKFQLGQRPEAGKPLLITLRLVANQPLEQLVARFLPDDDIQINQGGDFDPQGHMEPGATVDHSLTLTPGHEGVYTVLATVTTGPADTAVSRSFVIPIVVGGAPVAQAPLAPKPLTSRPAATKAKSHLGLPF